MSYQSEAVFTQTPLITLPKWNFSSIDFFSYKASGTFSGQTIHRRVFFFGGASLLRAITVAAHSLLIVPPLEKVFG